MKAFKYIPRGQGLDDFQRFLSFCVRTKVVSVLEGLTAGLDVILTGTTRRCVCVCFHWVLMFSCYTVFYMLLGGMWPNSRLLRPVHFHSIGLKMPLPLTKKSFILNRIIYPIISRKHVYITMSLCCPSC